MTTPGIPGDRYSALLNYFGRQLFYLMSTEMTAAGIWPMTLANRGILNYARQGTRR